MLTRQISEREEVALLRNGQAVERLDVTLVELVIFLEVEIRILMDTKFFFFFIVKDGVHPIAVAHIHRVNVAWFDNIGVDIGVFDDELHRLSSVLGDHSG